MATECRRTFDDSLLSGYLDGALGQSEEQRVRLHLEDCVHCRAMLEEMKELREMTISTRFEMPTDDQWNEAPRGSLSRLFRGLGWLLSIAWVLSLVGFVAAEWWAGSAGTVERLLIFGGVSALAFLFLSILMDRWSTYRLDRYRGVRK